MQFPVKGKESMDMAPWSQSILLLELEVCNPVVLLITLAMTHDRLLGLVLLNYSKFGLKSASGYFCWRELWEDVRSEEHFASLGNVADGI